MKLKDNRAERRSDDDGIDDFAWIYGMFGHPPRWLSCLVWLAALLSLAKIGNCHGRCECEASAEVCHQAPLGDPDCCGQSAPYEVAHSKCASLTMFAATSNGPCPCSTACECRRPNFLIPQAEAETSRNPTLSVTKIAADSAALQLQQDKVHFSPVENRRLPSGHDRCVQLCRFNA